MSTNIAGTWTAAVQNGKTVYTSNNVVVKGPVNLTGGTGTTLTVTNGAVVDGLTSDALPWSDGWPQISLQSGGSMINSHPQTVVTIVSSGAVAHDNLFENSYELVLSGAVLGPPNTRTGAGFPNGNGSIRVSSGGTIDGMTFGNGVTLSANSGAEIINSTVASGGSVVVSRGAGFSGLTIQSGANATITVPDGFPAPQFDGLSVVSGGNVTISGGAGGSDPLVTKTSPAATTIAGVWSAVLSNGVTVYTSGSTVINGPVHLTGGDATQLYVQSGATVSGLSSDLRDFNWAWPSVHVDSGGTLTDSYVRTVVTYMSSGSVTTSNLFEQTAERVLSGAVMGPGNAKQGRGDVFVSSGGTVDGLYSRNGSVVSALNGGVLKNTSTGSGATTSAFPGATVSFPTVMNGGTLSMTGAQVMVCFLPGTMIETIDGQVPVEQLTVGTSVMTLCVETGERKPVPLVWLGRQSVVSDETKPDDESGLPVRIRQHAFAQDVPNRDLWVTSEHCFAFEGRFVPVRMLVNGNTIAYDRSRPVYECFHIELPRHSVILANGTETESYLDTGNRSRFSAMSHEGSEGRDIGASAPKTWLVHAALPMDVSRAFVEPIFRRLAARAPSCAQGEKRPENNAMTPQLLLVTDGGLRLTPVRMGSEKAVFTVPANTRSVELVSEAARPFDQIGPFVDDRRKLGVLVSNVTLYGPANTQPVEGHLTDDRLDGWWGQEDSRCRWTNGMGKIDLPEVESNAPFMLAIDISDAMTGALGNDASTRPS